jgi:hypothetical protein
MANIVDDNIVLHWTSLSSSAWDMCFTKRDHLDDIVHSNLMGVWWEGQMPRLSSLDLVTLESIWATYWLTYGHGNVCHIGELLPVMLEVWGSKLCVSIVSGVRLFLA